MTRPIPPRAHGRPLVLGHRGASADAPENTLAAFALALAQGADGFELDVWRCGSGELVVIHDADARRTAGAALPVARTSWTELRRLDAGGWKDPRFAGERLPLLDEVLAAFPRAVVNVELKSDGRADPALAAGVARAIRDHGARERAIVSSFDPLLLAAFRASAPRVAAAMLLGADQQPWRAYALAGRLLRVSAIHADRALATRARIAAWKRGGRAVCVWTVDADADVVALCGAGVDALITNRPGPARAAVRRATGL